MEQEHGVLLYWIPLGAGVGGRWVRAGGRSFEAWSAVRERRRPMRLYHAALVVQVDGGRYAIEMAPVWSLTAAEHGAVGEGPVGVTWLGRWRLFRYEVRCWRDGVIPDLAHAVGPATVVSNDLARARHVLDLARSFPCATWGRDELGTGDMWNSNSLVAWLLVRSGHAMERIAPPPGGRAPGWAAGVTVAERSVVATPS